jgi:hypothetical protein
VKVVLTHDFDEEDADGCRTLAPEVEVVLAAEGGLAAELADADAVMCFRPARRGRRRRAPPPARPGRSPPARTA